MQSFQRTLNAAGRDLEGLGQWQGSDGSPSFWGKDATMTTDGKHIQIELGKFDVHPSYCVVIMH